LKKLREKPLEGGHDGAAAAAPAADAHAAEGHGGASAGEIPAEDSLILPPKASDKPEGEQKAEAGH
jgi:hypothetical protein